MVRTLEDDPGVMFMIWDKENRYRLVEGGGEAVEKV
jgi:hypothetical protein